MLDFDGNLDLDPALQGSFQRNSYTNSTTGQKKRVFRYFPAVAHVYVESYVIYLSGALPMLLF